MRHGVFLVLWCVHPANFEDISEPFKKEYSQAIRSFWSHVSEIVKIAVLPSRLSSHINKNDLLFAAHGPNGIIELSDHVVIVDSIDRMVAVSADI